MGMVVVVFFVYDDVVGLEQLGVVFDCFDFDVFDVEFDQIFVGGGYFVVIDQVVECDDWYFFVVCGGIVGDVEGFVFGV